MIAAGIGATSAATVDDIDRALIDAGISSSYKVDCIATFAGAPFASALDDAARSHGVRALYVTQTAMLARGHDCKTVSERSIAAHGVPSVAEACALVAAGDGSRLIVQRLFCGVVTIALAESAAPSP